MKRRVVYAASMITTPSMDGALLTNSQEERLYTELGDFNNMDLPLSISDLDLEFANSQKYSQSQLFVNCGTSSTSESKEALHASLALQPQQQHQQNHHQQQQQYDMQHQQELQLQDQEHHIQQHQAVFQQTQVQTPILGREEFSGQYNFQLILNPMTSGKHWIYSEKLAKVFIHMEEVLPLQFQWTPPVDGLWLRATLVYKMDQYRSEPVVRCHNHKATTNSSNRDVNEEVIHHVVRCLHATSIYQTSNGHLSVLIPLGAPDAGMAHVPVDYKFFCKNSCTHGMNRRATEIIFTLENQQNVVLGRKKLEIRICSCPKRDKDKEELELDPRGSIVSKNNTLIRKRKPGSQHDHVPHTSYKKKLTQENQVYSLNLHVCGKENALAVMKYACDVMSGCGVKNDNIDLYKPFIDKIENDMQRIE